MHALSDSRDQTSYEEKARMDRLNLHFALTHIRTAVGQVEDALQRFTDHALDHAPECIIPEYLLNQLELIKHSMEVINRAEQEIRDSVNGLGTALAAIAAG